MSQLRVLLDEEMYFNIVLRAGCSLSYLVYFRHSWGKRVERTDLYFFLQLHDETVVLNLPGTAPSLRAGCWDHNWRESVCHGDAMNSGICHATSHAQLFHPAEKNPVFKHSQLCDRCRGRAMNPFSKHPYPDSKTKAHATTYSDFFLPFLLFDGHVSASMASSQLRRTTLF